MEIELCPFCEVELEADTVLEFVSEDMDIFVGIDYRCPSCTRRWFKQKGKDSELERMDDK